MSENYRGSAGSMLSFRLAAVYSSPSFRILVVDDLSDNLFLLQTVLEAEGYEVDTADNGNLALAKVEASPPDLILMDVRMPKMTGYEACEKLKADPQVASIPVVFLSAKGQESEIRTGLEAGAAEYLLKPFAPAELTERVAELLKKYGKQP